MTNPTADKAASAEAGIGAMKRKAVNDAIAYIRSLAELRGRNADWAESAVSEAVSLSAEAALELGVIDVIASDDAGSRLLKDRRAHGHHRVWQGSTGDGRGRRRASSRTGGTGLLSVITNPERRLS